MSRYRRATGACVAAALLTSGCSVVKDVGLGDEEAGPLRISVGAGGVSLDRPPHVPWSGSFGSAVLCTVDGSTARIEKVTYDFTTEPLDVSTGLHVVEPQEQVPRDSGIVGSKRGRPERFVNKLHTVRGTFYPALGLAVTNKCLAKPGEKLTELLTTMKVGRRGGWIRKWSVDYTANGHHYSVDLAWQMVACGTRTRRFCGS